MHILIVYQVFIFTSIFKCLILKVVFTVGLGYCNGKITFSDCMGVFVLVCYQQLLREHSISVILHISRDIRVYEKINVCKKKIIIYILSVFVSLGKKTLITRKIRDTFGAVLLVNV